MALHNLLPDNIDEVDVIIAGGGTAGCVVAGRLASADPSLSILVVEQGPNNANDPTITNPMLCLAHLAPGSKTTLFYKGINRFQDGSEREVFVPCGGVLGGGSSVNLLMYSRAQKSDFDAWSTLGWSSDDLLPYMKRLETYHGPDPHGAHGIDGPIHVSKGPFYAPTAQNSFMAALRKLGWPEVDDMQRFGATNGAMRALRYVSPDGVRSDAAHAYLHPLLRDGEHPNLHVVVNTVVHRVVFENKRAVGILCAPKTSPDDASTKAAEPRTIKARRMVVMSAGACGTPLILERSGVGNADILNRAGVPAVADVPGVGSDFQDHQLLVYPYKSNLAPEETADRLMTGGMEVVTEMMQKGEKILGWNAQDVTCKLRPNEEDIAAMGPKFKEAWDRHFRDVPDKPLTLMSLIGGFPALDPKIVIDPGQYFGISVFSSYPLSRGHVHITGPNVDDAIDFVTPIYNDPDGFDLAVARWAFRKQREIARRMDIYRGFVAMANPAFPDGSDAAASHEKEYPLPQDLKDIEYSKEDDAVLDKYLRANAGSTWHPLGTCKMAPLESGGVVDASLSVYGVERLKVADLSIPPSNVGSNTANTALLIGEKAADILIEELGLNKVSST